jgi:hypothetical protein
MVQPAGAVICSASSRSMPRCDDLDASGGAAVRDARRNDHGRCERPAEVQPQAHE